MNAQEFTLKIWFMYTLETLKKRQLNKINMNYFKKHSKIIIPALGLFLISTLSLNAQTEVECNWGLEECFRVKDVNGHTYVYHGVKVENEQIR